ncbi:hypothetical protein K438DRAFT_2020039 [Mycena galopus ATCC 62051]|nr:hypothetical protein K438DRAFT_2020039 [Mycena galopus ATCC 62051]
MVLTTAIHIGTAAINSSPSRSNAFDVVGGIGHKIFAKNLGKKGVYSADIENTKGTQRPAEAFALRTPFLLPIPLPLPLLVLYLPVCLPVPHIPQDRCAAARLDGHEHCPHACSARDPAPRPRLPLLGRHGPAIGPSPETLHILLDAAQLLDDPSPPEPRGAGAEISAQAQAPYRSGVWRGRPAAETAVQVSAQAVLGAPERAHIARLLCLRTRFARAPRRASRLLYQTRIVTPCYILRPPHEGERGALPELLVLREHDQAAYIRLRKIRI